MNISLALRTKNRLVERIRALETKIKKNNSVLEGNKSVDVEALLSERSQLVTKLIQLKLALQQASQPVMAKILELSELKSEMAFLGSVSTKEGLVADNNIYGKTDPLSYKAAINQDQIDQKVLDLQTRFDDLQTQIDEFNATTKVDIKFEL